MGSKKKKIAWENQTTNAYGKTITNGEKQRIDNHNSAERTEGQKKDANWQVERQAVAQKSGTIEYKSIIRKHMDKIGSILGVKG